MSVANHTGGALDLGPQIPIKGPSKRIEGFKETKEGGEKTNLVRMSVHATWQVLQVGQVAIPPFWQGLALSLLLSSPALQEVVEIQDQPPAHLFELWPDIFLICDTCRGEEEIPGASSSVSSSSLEESRRELRSSTFHNCSYSTWSSFVSMNMMKVLLFEDLSLFLALPAHDCHPLILLT